MQTMPGTATMQVIRIGENGRDARERRTDVSRLDAMSRCVDA